MALTTRAFLGEEFFKFATQDLEEMNRFRNEVSKRRPSEEEKLIMQINKPWISFWNTVLSNVREI
jgi:chloramphenicol O-acetyltransferase